MAKSQNGANTIFNGDGKHGKTDTFDCGRAERAEWRIIFCCLHNFDWVWGCEMLECKPVT